MRSHGRVNTGSEKFAEVLKLNMERLEEQLRSMRQDHGTARVAVESYRRNP